MKNNFNKIIFSYFFFIFIFLILTNTHFDYHESLQFGGADGFSYISISKSAPLFTAEQMMSIHSERFFFPYILGLISKLIKIDIYSIYKILVFVFFIIINLILLKIFKYLNISIHEILIFLTLINFNPYITRFYIAVPTIINDLIFVAGLLLILEKIITKNNNRFLIIFGYIFAFASRQTSISIFIGYIISKFIKGKKIIKFNYELIGLLIFILFITLGFYYSSNVTVNLNSIYELYSPKMRLFGLFLQNIPFKEKIIFLILPILSYAPLIFYLILTRKIVYSLKEISKSKLLVFLFSVIIMIIAQPILSGAGVTGRNILRLTTLAYIPLLIFFLLITKERQNLIKYKTPLTITFIIIAVFHSFHPTFSKISIFETLKF